MTNQLDDKSSTVKLSPAKRAILRHLAKLRGEDRLLTIKFAPPSAEYRRQQRLEKLEALRGRCEALADAEFTANAPVRAAQQARSERLHVIEQAKRQAARASAIEIKIAALQKRWRVAKEAHSKYDLKYKGLELITTGLTEDERTKKLANGKKSDEAFFEIRFVESEMDKLNDERRRQKDIPIPPEPPLIEPTYDGTAWEAMRAELEVIAGDDMRRDHVLNMVSEQITQAKSADYECNAIEQIYECGLTPWMIETAPPQPPQNIDAVVAWFSLEEPIGAEAVADMLPEGATIVDTLPFAQAYSKAPYVGLLDEDGERTNELPTLPIARTPQEYAALDIEDADFLLDEILNTSSRWLLAAEKGTGKSMFMMALGMRVSLGLPFLHWKNGRPSRVLLVDGEMSLRLLKQRIADETKRIGRDAPNFFTLNHAQYKNFTYLNTPEGQQIIDNYIEYEMGGDCDLVIFDNLNALLSGSKIGEESWAGVEAWSKKTHARWARASLGSSCRPRRQTRLRLSRQGVGHGCRGPALR